MYSDKRVQLYNDILKLHEAGYGLRMISRTLHCSRNTVTKYINGNFDAVCKSSLYSSLNRFYDTTVKLLSAGMCRKDVLQNLKENGYTGGKSAAYNFMNAVAKEQNISISVGQSTTEDVIQKRVELMKYDYVGRSEIFRFLWMNEDMPDKHIAYLFSKYPILLELKACIKEFRVMFALKRLPMLFLFIDKYSQSSIKELSVFVAGLNKDIDAVTNAVSSPLSNGFVEGTNSKLKMVKRTMYGRCSHLLLAAKLMLHLRPFTCICG